MARPVSAAAWRAHSRGMMWLGLTSLNSVFVVMSCLPLSTSNSLTTELGFAQPTCAFTTSSVFRAGSRVHGMKPSHTRLKSSDRPTLNMAAKLQPSEQALRSLINVLAKHRNDGSIQAKGCEALVELSSRSELARMQVFEVGGVDVVLAAMAAHPDNDSVQRQATLLLGGEAPPAVSPPPRPVQHRNKDSRGDAVAHDPVASPEQTQVVEAGALEREGQPDQEEEQQQLVVELASDSALTEARTESEETQKDPEVFQGRLSPFAKDIDPDLDAEAFRDALRDNIYAFQKKSLGNQFQESYMNYLKGPEEGGKDTSAAKAATRGKYDLYARSPRSQAVDEKSKKGTGTLRKPIVRARAVKTSSNKDMSEVASTPLPEEARIENAGALEVEADMAPSPSLSLSSDVLLQLQQQQEEEDQEQAKTKAKEERETSARAVKRPPSPSPSPSLLLSPDVLLQLQEEEEQDEEQKQEKKDEGRRDSALTEARTESEETQKDAEVFQGRLSPFAKDIDPDLDAEAFRDALRDNIYAFQKKSLGNQFQESYMNYLKGPEEGGKDTSAAKAATRGKYDLYARSPRSQAVEEKSKKGTGTLRKPIARARAVKKNGKSADKSSDTDDVGRF